jgi:hypothetical protein
MEPSLTISFLHSSLLALPNWLKAERQKILALPSHIARCCC